MATRHVTYVNKPIYVLPIKDKNDIGKVIGKGGARIRELEEMSGAKIAVNSAQSTVSIYGDEQAAVDAKFLVQRIIGGPNNRILKDLDEKSIQCISQAAEWLEKLQARLDVYIEISSRDIIIEADDEMIKNLDEAERLIAEKLESMLELKTETIALKDGNQLSLVFQDPMIVSLRDAHGLTLETVKTDAGTGVSLSGSAAIVEEAKTAINAIVCGGGTSMIVMLCPGMLAEFDEDKWYDFNGDLNRYVIREYNVMINFQRTSDRLILSTVADDGAELLKSATRVCQEILLYYLGDRSCLFYCRPPQALQSVLGREDGELVRLSNRECILTVDREKAHVWIAGNAKFVRSAAARLEANLDRWKANNLIVNIPDERCKGFIVGTGGERLRKIQNDSGCLVTCDSTYVLIEKSDPQGDMNLAKEMVEQSIQQWRERRPPFRQQGQYQQFPPTPGRGRGGQHQQFPGRGGQQQQFPPTPKGRGRFY